MVLPGQTLGLMPGTTPHLERRAQKKSGPSVGQQANQPGGLNFCGLRHLSRERRKPQAVLIAVPCGLAAEASEQAEVARDTTGWRQPPPG
jgi:hypothetical protein